MRAIIITFKKPLNYWQQNHLPQHIEALQEGFKERDLTQNYIVQLQEIAPGLKYEVIIDFEGFKETNSILAPIHNPIVKRGNRVVLDRSVSVVLTYIRKSLEAMEVPPEDYTLEH